MARENLITAGVNGIRRRRDTLIALQHFLRTGDDVGGLALAVFFPFGACYVCLQYQLVAWENYLYAA
jgi:hypothetical protein